ncbi:hypothetical protein AB1Y20_018422 [Prymnesium parvum]|uniref:Presenilin n=1 Tax=Prymnesium parvum TaxID=97485 RepID=A0AB34JND0_PRYPA
MTDRRAERAAALLQHRWREHALELRVCRLLRAQAREAARQAEERAHARSLAGAASTVWPVLREAAGVMAAAALLACLAPAAYEEAAPFLAVDEGAAAAEQWRHALLGGAVLVGAFALLFAALLALYLAECLRGFYLLHSLWIGGLLAAPAALLLVRLCQEIHLPVDVVSVGLFGWNLSMPLVVVVHWHATERRFATLRRLYVALLSSLATWLLVPLPWQTAVAAVLELALLDVVLVLAPTSPVQKLDKIHRMRRRTGEPQMPGLTFKAEGLELGMGDFIIFSALAGYAARRGVSSLAIALVGVLVGLIPTMFTLALANERRVVPALPLSVAIGCLLLVIDGSVLSPFKEALAAGHVFL